MRRFALAVLTLTCLFGVGAAARAAPANATPTLPGLIRPLLAPATGMGSVGDWGDLDKDPAVTWAPGPTMQDKPSPDGNYFSRAGRAMVGGRPLDVLATGARSGVLSVYIRDPATPPDAGAAMAEFRRAGYAVEVVRCPIHREAAAKHWLRLTVPGKRPAFLSVGPQVSGGSDYVLLLADDELTPMTPHEAAVYTDNCGVARP